MKANMLFIDPPLVISPSAAKQFGLIECIILQQIHYWLCGSNHHYEGKVWAFNSYTKWQLQFPFLSVGQIKAAILRLENDGLIVSGNFNRAKFDRTKWYTINYDRVAELSPVFNGATLREKPNDFPSSDSSPSLAAGRRSSAAGSQPIPETNYQETTSGEPLLFVNGSGIDQSKYQIQAEKIYALYPNKIGRPVAIKAIVDVLKGGSKKHPAAFPAEFVEEKTRLFAATWANASAAELSYCPHPSTWFNQERFNDDPANWRRPTNKNGTLGLLRLKQATLRDRVDELKGQLEYHDQRMKFPAKVAELKALSAQLKAVNDEIIAFTP